MHMERQELDELIQMLWMSFMNTQLNPAPTLDPDAHKSLMTAVVRLTGEDETSIFVECTKEMAREIASSMFQCGQDELAPDEVHDALGEIANVLGGNIKGVLAMDHQLSLPVVVEGPREHVKSPNGEVMHHVGYTCAGSPIQFTLARRTLNAALSPRA